MRGSRSITNRLHLIALGAVLAGAAACGAFHRGSGQPPAYLYFTNESLDQADVFATLPGNLPIRIGTVFAGRTDTLTVPPDLLGRGNVNVSTRLLARSAGPSTGPFAIQSGDHLQVRLSRDQRLLIVLPE
jgi:hypothetical protein